MHSLLIQYETVHKYKHQKLQGCALLWKQKKEKRKSTTDNLLPASHCLKHKKLKTDCVSGRWLGCSFSWISWAVYDSSLLGLDGGSLASSVLWVETTQSLSCLSMQHDMSTTQLHLFFQLFLWYQLLCLPWIKQINVCFHYAAMGFAEWENMRWTQLSMQHTCWLHTTAKMISDLADEFHASYFILLHFMFIYFYEGCK